MNIVSFAMPFQAYMNPAAFGSEGPADCASWAFSFIFIDGKMRALFSLLFGASMLLVIERAEASDARQIVLDLRELTFIDSSGVRMIVCADLRSRQDGDRLRLIRGGARVQRVFELTGVLERLPFEP